MNSNRAFNVLKQGYSLKSEAHTKKTLKKIDTASVLDHKFFSDCKLLMLQCVTTCYEQVNEMAIIV